MTPISRKLTPNFKHIIDGEEKEYASEMTLQRREFLCGVGLDMCNEIDLFHDLVYAFNIELFATLETYIDQELLSLV